MSSNRVSFSMMFDGPSDVFERTFSIITGGSYMYKPVYQPVYTYIPICSYSGVSDSYTGSYSGMSNSFTGTN